MRAYLAFAFGAAVPLVEEWEATGLQTLGAWRGGHLTWSALVAAHNGAHPIAITRLWEIFWFEAAGGWDPLLILIAKAAVYALAAVCYVEVLAGGARRDIGLGAILSVFFTLPVCWQNLIWAFQSQFDFFLLFSGLAWLCLSRLRLPWALLAATAALFTIGAGPVVPASFLPFLIAKRIEGAIGCARAWVYIGLAAAATVVGVVVQTERTVTTDVNVSATTSLRKALAWPVSDVLHAARRADEIMIRLPPEIKTGLPLDHLPVKTISALVMENPGAIRAAEIAAALLLALPVLFMIALRGGGRISNRYDGPLGVALFAMSLLISMACVRPSNGAIANRYLDLVVLDGPANGTCAMILADHARAWRRICAAWWWVWASGVLAMTAISFVQLSSRYPDRCRELVRQYFASGDVRVLTDEQRYQLLVSDERPEHFLGILNAAELPRPVGLAGEDVSLPLISRAARTVARYAAWLAPLALLGIATAWLDAIYSIYRRARCRLDAIFA